MSAFRPLIVFALTSFLFPVYASALSSTDPLWSGDLRHRSILLREGASDVRPYQQIRARLQWRTQVTPEASALLRFATGTGPISANQTLGDSSDPGFVRRSFGLDLAAALWMPAEGVTIALGKVPNPFFSSGENQLIFDSDVTFEGASVRYSRTGDYGESFVNAGAFLIAENFDSGSATDTADLGIASLQLAHRWKSGSHGLVFHLGTYNFSNIQDQPLSRIEKSGRIDSLSLPGERFRGNRVYTLLPSDPIATRPYRILNKFHLDVLGIEYRLTWTGGRVLAFADLVKNREVSDAGMGHEVGLEWTRERTSVGIAHARKEADSVIGSFTDSDTNGGGTDVEGYRVTLGYAFNGRSNLRLSQYVARRGISANERGLSSTHLDLVLKFDDSPFQPAIQEPRP